ncbi:PH domain-containing protein [Patescibacteria group bacterium]|nr:PH domain-containing protein [Patescibacteria group bacterium]MBU2123730.1 PH domain-containing protein [Patescibacteria group bacterium]MBU2194586.1 PH domain-containing protein [Patescibacteria group bacterium]MBU2330445.1 PH domain-containing protein [Patescibacteria group bacterium]
MNPFQAQFPLSPRKFWKKFLPVIIPSILFSAFVGVFFAFFLPFFHGNLELSAESMIRTSILLTVGLSILVLALYAWYFKVYIRTYSYEGGDNFIRIKKGVFAPREIHVQYQKIQDVYVDQDILDRILGIYDVHISSATMSSGMEAHIDGVNKDVADGLREFFLNKVQRATVGYVDPAAPAMAEQNQAAAPVQLSEEISSAAYPIRPMWMVVSVLGTIFMSLIIGLFTAGYAVAKTSDDGDGLPFLGTFLVFTAGYFVFHFIGILLWKSNYSFQLTPDYVLYRTGILSKSERHLPYRTIQDVSISQSFFDRIFGLYNVVIENAAQVAMTKGRLSNANIKLVGLAKDQATHITETLKPIILSKTSIQTGI